MFFPGVKTSPINPASASPSTGIIDLTNGRSGLNRATAAAVVTVRVLEAGEPLVGVTLAGLNAQLAWLGRVLQLN